MKTIPKRIMETAFITGGAEAASVEYMHTYMLEQARKNAPMYLPGRNIVRIEEVSFEKRDNSDDVRTPLGTGASYLVLQADVWVEATPEELES